MELAVFKLRSLVLTKAEPLPGLTCWKVTIWWISPRKRMNMPFWKPLVETCDIRVNDILPNGYSNGNRRTSRIFFVSQKSMAVRSMPKATPEERGRPDFNVIINSLSHLTGRSKERRVGKEYRSRLS